MVDHIRSKLGLIAQQNVLIGVVVVTAAVVVMRPSSTADAGWHCGYGCGGRWRNSGE